MAWRWRPAASLPLGTIRFSSPSASFSSSIDSKSKFFCLCAFRTFPATVARTFLLDSPFRCVAGDSESDSSSIAASIALTLLLGVSSCGDVPF